MIEVTKIINQNTTLMWWSVKITEGETKLKKIEAFFVCEWKESAQYQTAKFPVKAQTKICS